MPDSQLSSRDQKRLDALYESINEANQTYVGYPSTSDLDYSPLYRFLNFSINNIGDPFVPCNFRLNTREIECEVLRWFARLNHAPEDDFWGYVTNGGTEGNLYGLYLARELLPNGVVYYSQDTHYSVSKNLRLLKMQNIMIKSQSNGEIDYEDLYETINIHRDVPPIIFANIGTTMTEAVDNVGRIQNILRDLAISTSYIHCDAALSGMILPFIEDAPIFDFRAGIDSMAISGHKFIGSPIPCGIVLARKGIVNRIARSIEYVGTLDTTVTGSRNGITPLILWYAIRKNGVEGFKRIVNSCIELADYTIAELKKIGLEAWRNRHAITVVFPQPPQPVLDHWQIAVQNGKAHVITMPNITKERIDHLIGDIHNSLKQPSEERAVEEAEPDISATSFRNVQKSIMKQITIVTENHPNLFADITNALASRDINIESMDAEEIQGLEVVTLMVDQYDKALQALRDASLHAVTEDAVVLRIRDEPGALAKVAQRFKDEDVHIRSIRVIYRQDDWGLIAISMDRTERALAVVRDLTATP